MADDHLLSNQAVSQQGYALMPCRSYIPRAFGDLFTHYAFDFQSTRSNPSVSVEEREGKPDSLQG